jgi:oligopeptide/dipeptide ABC transporter ATP-binding protein
MLASERAEMNTITPAGAGPQLEIQDLWVQIGRGLDTVHAVRGVSLTVVPGARLGIVGESGSGKTMTANAVLRVLPAAGRIVRGEINFNGRDLVRLGERELERIRGREISMVFQNAKAALNPVFPIGDQIATVYRTHTGGSRREAHERTVEMLARMGIPNPRERANAYPHELSGGMAQRVMIAMGLICEPALLLADEPTTGLDLTIQAQVLEVMEESLAERATTLVLISHDIGVVRALCDEIVVMYAGEVVEAGPISLVLDHPSHPYTQGLVSSYLADDRPVYIAGRIPSMRREFAGCSFADRCRYADDRSRSERPQLRRLPDGRLVACHKAEELIT